MPLEVWTDIPATDYDPDSPITSQLYAVTVGNIIHVRQTVYNPDIHIPQIAHNHDGINSALLSLPGVNLVVDWHPRRGAEGNNVDYWQTDGCSVGTSGVENLISAGNFAKTVLGDVGRKDNSLNMIGDSCDLVLACYVYADGPLSAGALSLGLMDESGGAFVGTYATFPYTEFSNGSWTRIWTKKPAVTRADFSDAICWGAKVTTGVTGGRLIINIVEALPGNALSGAPIPGNNPRMGFNDLLAIGLVPTYDQTIWGNPVFYPAV